MHNPPPLPSPPHTLPSHHTQRIEPFLKRKKYLLVEILLAFSITGLVPVQAFEWPKGLDDPERLGSSKFDMVYSYSVDGDIQVTDDVTLYNTALITSFDVPMTIDIGAGKTLKLDTELGSSHYDIGMLQAEYGEVAIRGGNLVLQYQGPTTNETTGASYIAFANIEKLTLTGTNLNVIHSQNGLRADGVGGLLSVTGGDTISVNSDIGETQHHAVTVYDGGNIVLDAAQIDLVISGQSTSGSGDSSVVQLTSGGKVDIVADQLVMRGDVDNIKSNYGIFSSGGQNKDANVNLSGKGADASFVMAVENNHAEKSTAYGILSNPSYEGKVSTVAIRDFNDVSISSKQYALWSYGTRNDSKAAITLENNGDVSVSSASSRALASDARNGGNALITVQDNRSVEISSFYDALYTTATAGGQASVNLSGNDHVTLASSSSGGAWAYAEGENSLSTISLDNTRIDMAGSFGLVSQADKNGISRIDVKGDSVLVKGTGDDGFGVYGEAYNGASTSVSITGNSVTVSGNKAAITNDGSSGVGNISVQATGLLHIVTSASGAVSDSYGNATTNINTTDDAGRTILSGGVFSKEGATTHIGLNTQDSVWTGAGYDGRDIAGKEGSLNVTARNGATWRVESVSDYEPGLGKSMVSIWNSIGSSTIDMTWESGYQSLDIRTLKGENTVFRFETDVNATRGQGNGTDQAIIHSGNGNHSIVVNSTGRLPWTAEQKDYLVWHQEKDGMTSVPVGQNGTGNALSFSLANRGQVVDVGLYWYELASRNALDGNGTEWYLKRSEKKDPTPSGDLTTSLSGIMVPASIWWNQLTDLRKRLGEVRYGAQDGFWVRALAWEDEAQGITHSRFHQDVQGLNVGLDHIVRRDEQGMWLMGGNLKIVHADQKTTVTGQGRGENDSWGLNLYATWAGQKGCYADFVLSFDHYRQKMQTTMTDWNVTRGRYSTYGLGASIEVGKMFSATQAEGWGGWNSNWFAEPQAQLAYYWVRGKNFSLDNGLQVAQKNMDSLTGRLGLVLGKRYNGGKVRKEMDRHFTQFYLEGGVKQELAGNQSIRVNGMEFSDKPGGTRLYYGVGMDWNFTDRTRMYAQLERENGSQYQKDYYLTIGLKHQF